MNQQFDTLEFQNIEVLQSRIYDHKQKAGHKKSNDYIQTSPVINCEGKNHIQETINQQLLHSQTIQSCQIRQKNDYRYSFSQNQQLPNLDEMQTHKVFTNEFVTQFNLVQEASNPTIFYQKCLESDNPDKKIPPKNCSNFYNLYLHLLNKGYVVPAWIFEQGDFMEKWANRWLQILYNHNEQTKKQVERWYQNSFMQKSTKLFLKKANQIMSKVWSYADNLYSNLSKKQKFNEIELDKHYSEICNLWNKVYKMYVLGGRMKELLEIVFEKTGNNSQEYYSGLNANNRMELMIEMIEQRSYLQGLYNAETKKNQLRNKQKQLYKNKQDVNYHQLEHVQKMIKLLQKQLLKYKEGGIVKRKTQHHNILQKYNALKSYIQ